MKTLVITGGEVLIDDEDFERVSKFKWSISGHQDRQNIHVARKLPKDPLTGKRHLLMLHRFILGETDPLVKIDHKNGNPFDNRKENLRKATTQQNNCNRRQLKKISSGYKGVSWHSPSKKWQAQIALNRVKYFLGLFEDPYIGHLAYQKKALELHGEFARFE